MNRMGHENSNFKHGLTNGKSFRHPVYTAWQNMKSRCLNPKNEKYNRYGGRGIKICDEWMNSFIFAQWAFSSGWQKGLTIDRKDNDGDYCPSNCHWILVSLNSRKKSTTKLTLDQAEHIRNLSKEGYENQELANMFNTSNGTVWFILKNMTWK